MTDEHFEFYPYRDHQRMKKESRSHSKHAPFSKTPPFVDAFLDMDDRTRHRHVTAVTQFYTDLYTKKRSMSSLKLAAYASCTFNVDKQTESTCPRCHVDAGKMITIKKYRIPSQNNRRMVSRCTFCGLRKSRRITIRKDNPPARDTPKKQPSQPQRGSTVQLPSKMKSTPSSASQRLTSTGKERKSPALQNLDKLLKAKSRYSQGSTSTGLLDFLIKKI